MLYEKQIRIKMILLGDSGVGKTAIIQRYYEDKFDANLKLTYNAHYLEKELEINGQKVTLELWDTAGQEEYHALTQIFVKNAKIILLVYNITSLKSFENLSYWYDFIKKEIGINTVLGLAGNKTDLIFEENYNEEVNAEKGRELAKKIGATFSLVSAKESLKEIMNLFTELISKYLDIRDFDPDNESTIRLESLSQNSSKSGCCSGSKKKVFTLKMIFLGCKGVGKTSIIKGLKGNTDVKNLSHTKASNTEKINYNKHGQDIIVELKDTNWEQYYVDNLASDIKHYKVFFLVYDIYKKDTLYALKDLMKNLDKNKNKIYLLGYINESKANANNEFDFREEGEKMAKKYGCEYDSVSIEDIYKVKSIILENIRHYLALQS